MLDFEILASGFFLPERMHIIYDSTLVMSATAEERNWMENRWQERLLLLRQRNIPLFNAPLFRFISAEVVDTSALTEATSEPSARHLKLVLGNTNYKEYVTTREAAFASKHSHHELGNPLAVCSVVETSDGHILLDKREGVEVYPGRYHVIGGFFERHLDLTAESQPDPFGAMRREIHEETGVLSTDIARQICLGAVYDLLMPHAELCFLTQLHIPLATVLTRTPLDREIKNLLHLEVNQASLRDFILTNHGNISSTGEPNLLLYGQWKFGNAWFEEIMQVIGENR